MPAIARANGIDSVNINHATCQGSTVTDEGSSTVFVNGHPVVLEGNAVESHTFSPPVCPSHNPGLTTFSGTVAFEGKRVGRVGDQYGCGASIATGSPNVIVG
jgi:uncharacterized Zn-binding protein involved in type VI secretion